MLRQHLPPHVSVHLFGQQYDLAFQKGTHGLSPHEIPLFKAMRAALLTTAGSGFHVEEYHGGGHQVRFTGQGVYVRPQARCELSDLMVVVCDPQTGAARLTYIQAKSERKVPFSTTGLSGRSLAANLEQWDLLGRRPQVTGVGKFQPPNDLLSASPFDSVGCFAFFLQDSAGYFETYYAAARVLRLAGRYTQRNGALIPVADCCPCFTVCPQNECTSLLGNARFAAALYALRIGLPIGPHASQASAITFWLAQLLRGVVLTRTPQEAELARAFANVLDPGRDAMAAEDVPTPSFGAKNLVLIQGRSVADFQEPVPRPPRKNQ